MAHLYYADAITGAEPGRTVTVTGDEARHAVKVARLRVGEQLALGDGSGTLAQATVTAVQGGSFTARCDEVTRHPHPKPELVLVQALAKGDRAERAVEQATEFGASRICFWQAERCVSRWSSADKQAKGIAKWERIAREASKQSLRPWVPEIGAFSVETLEQAPPRSTHPIAVLDPRADTPLSALLRPLRDTLTGLTCVVGPEGGISETELAELVARGAQPVRLGETVLRTSSAGPAALAVAHTVLGIW